MLGTIKDAADTSEQIQGGLLDEIKGLICDPMRVIGSAAIQAKIRMVQIDFIIPAPGGMAGWRRLYASRTKFCINPAGSCENGLFSISHGGSKKWDGVVLESIWPDTGVFLGPNDLAGMTQDRSELFDQDMLAALVDAVNQLGVKVLEAVQLKNERDTDLRARVGGTRKVNRDLLEALDRNRVLTV